MCMYKWNGVIKIRVLGYRILSGQQIPFPRDNFVWIQFWTKTKNQSCCKQAVWDMGFVYIMCKQCKLSLKGMNILFASTLSVLYTAGLV